MRNIDRIIPLGYVAFGLLGLGLAQSWHLQAGAAATLVFGLLKGFLS